MSSSLSDEGQREATLREAMASMRVGAADHAAALLSGILDEPKALLLLALLRDDQNDLVAATTLYQRYLDIYRDDAFAFHRLGRVWVRRRDDAAAHACFLSAIANQADYAAAFNDLGALLYRTGDHPNALVALDRAAALDPVDTTTQLNRAKLLAAMHRADAEAAFQAVLDLEPRSASEWCDRATASLHIGDLHEAETAARQAISQDADGDTALQARLLLAEILERAARRDEAQCERTEIGRRQSLITSPCLEGAPEARILLLGGAGCCNLPTDDLVDRRHFEITTLFLPPADVPNALDIHGIEALPRFDVVFNIIGDADAGVPFLGRAREFLQCVSCPVLNPPDRIPATRRDCLSQALADIPGLVAPSVSRLSVEALRRVATSSTFDGPLLLRSTGSHGGIGLVRVDNAAQFALAAEDAAGESYLSQFYDYSSPDGWFRKYRFAFVGGDLFPVHLAIGANWMVHYWRVDMADWMHAEEAAFLADYRTSFGPTASAALHDVATRLGLDFGGIDCGILRDGRVVLFEANATMLVHLNGVSAAKRAQAVRVRDAMSEHVRRACRASLDGQPFVRSPPE